MKTSARLVMAGMIGWCLAACSSSGQSIVGATLHPDDEAFTTSLRCVGTPDPCGKSHNCSDNLGCTEDLFCQGVHDSCATHDVSDCTSNPGCQVLHEHCISSDDGCGGLFPQGCGEYSGCVDTTYCTGMPTPCENLHVKDCAEQPGCRIE